MADKVYVGRKCQSFQSFGEYEPFSGVKLWRDDETYFFAGDDTGRVMETEHRSATQGMADNILNGIKGFVYKPFEAKGCELDPAAELGDAVTICGIYTMIGSMRKNYKNGGLVDIGLPGGKEINHEYPYKSPQDRELKRRVKLGQKYQGVQIDRLNGLTITETDGEALGAKVVLNSKELTFYDVGGGKVLYFDPVSKTYKFMGELNVNNKFIVDKLGNVTSNGSMVINGSLTMTGSSNWLMTRYSTNRNAPVPSGWTEAWDAKWDNTSTQVWAIYSYNGGALWTTPMLAQGKDGAQGPQGSQANIPSWVKAYTASAEFDTLVTNEWVVAMSLYGSKIFGGEYFDTAKRGKLTLSDVTGGFSDISYDNVKGGYNIFSASDNIGGATLFLYGKPIIHANKDGANLDNFVTVHAVFA